MKNLISISLTLVILTSSLISLAQVTASLKNEIKDDKFRKKEEKKELRILEGKEPSYQSKQAFISDFENVNAAWKRTRNFDEASFTKDGKVITAFYDWDSKLVGTVSPKSFSDLPVAAQEYINSKYSGWAKNDVILFDDNELNESDMLLYGKQFDDADNYFIELSKDNQKIVLESSMMGNVSYFTKIK